MEPLQVQRKIIRDNRSYTFQFELFLDCQKSDCQLGSVMYLINIFTGSPCWNRQNHGQTIHPAEKFFFNKFVKHTLGCKVDMIIFDLQGYGGC